MKRLLGRKRERHGERRDVWRAFAEVGDGIFEEGSRPFKDRVLFPHGTWTLVLDTYMKNQGQTQAPYTRVRAYVRGYRGLRLTVRRKNVLDRAWAALGFGRTLPVNPWLLDRFVVTGRPPAQVPSLLASSAVMEGARAAGSFHLHVKRPGWLTRRRLGTDVGVVVCLARGSVRDPVRLAGMVRLVREVLDGLHRVGGSNDAEVTAA